MANTTITYNGSQIASLEGGKTATLVCADQMAVADIVIAFGTAGIILYNETETAVEAEKTATLKCKGKKMLSNVVITVEEDGYTLEENDYGTTVILGAYTTETNDNGTTVIAN